MNHLSLAAPAAPASAQHSAAAAAEMLFLVPGMHCAGCIARIERGLARLPGIERVRANLSTRRVHVVSRQGGPSADDVRAALEDLGFDAAPFDPRLADESAKRERAVLLRAIAVAGFAAGNVMLLSVSVWAGLVSDMEPATRSLFHWLSALIALPAIAYAGQPFFRSAWRALRQRQMNMDVPITLAVLLAAGASLAETVRGAEHVYFDASITLVFFLLIGRYLDAAMRGRAGEAARNLLALRAVGAVRIEPDGRRVSVPVSALRPRDRVFVAPGMRVPADGIVRDGASDVDQSLITGESVPERAAVGDPVYAGTLNLSGPLVVEVTAPDDRSLLAEIARLLEAAEQSRAGYVRLADRLARIYAPAVHILAAGTFLGWLALGAGWHTALMTAIAVLIITCPCALGLAVPVAQVVAAGALLKRGILLKSGDALERLAAVDTVVFDKTGTLTTATLELEESGEITAADRALAVALATASRHPLAMALARAGAGTALPQLGDLHEVPGCGVEGRYEGARVRLGRRDWVGAAGEARGDGPQLWLARADAPPVRFTFRDRLRADAAEVIARLRQSGLRVVLLSGDHETVVAKTARALGIDDYRAECRPGDKIAALEALRAEGARVLMIGDGLNDAPALAAAHVSMSPATAADIAQTAADIVFQGERLMPVCAAHAMARRTARRVRENFALAFGYNAIAVPLAIAGLVTPLIAAVAMSASSLTVTLNALRLRLGGAA
ncbi:MAG: heavy metal translocating P-type ATPase [Rhodothalassiaceae bacterium]